VTAQPLVTVLLCHNGLRRMVKIAIDSYLSQDYPNRELIVVDDGPDLIFDLVMPIPACHYIQHNARNLSEKRNVGCKAARGEYIVHFDADDWSGPHRISDQVAMMQRQPGAAVGGYSSALWWDYVDRRASYYRGAVWSATYIYRRDYWLGHPWDEACSYAEDSPFLRPALDKHAVAQADGGQNFVATMHSKNARRAAAGTPGIWPYVGVDALPEAFRRAAGIDAGVTV
jgi:glycosyltransferase involved in cell wall biosynthesis